VSPADIVSAAIAVGVRVDRVVELSGGDDLRLAVIAAGGSADNSPSGVYTGLDSDGVEWRIAIVPGGSISVIAPAIPGATPTEQARFRRERDAREYASILRARRRDLSSQEIRLDVGGMRIGGA